MNKMPHIPRRSTDLVQWFIWEQGTRIVAQSGRPCDRLHIGKLMLQGFRDDPHFTAQIDGATGESETNKSLMERSVRCAIALRNFGLKTGDVIVVMAPNHMHLAVPVYAAMYLGVTVAALDSTLTVDALSDIFTLSEPKIVFCQSERAEDVRMALRGFNGNTKVVLFNEGQYQNLNGFVEEFGDETLVEDFIITRLQSSLEMTPAHAASLIHTYRPTYLISSPRFLSGLIQQEVSGYCDLTCFEVIMVGGSAVSKELIAKFKDISPYTDVYNCYGMTEASLFILDPVDVPPGNIGRTQGSLHYRLIDIDTEADITEPNKTGELCVKGPQVFKGYLKNPKATHEAFSEDGWLKTGDLMYRDVYWNFFYVDRLKMLLKYKTYKFFPLEMETTIGRHIAVEDVAVTGVPSPDGDRPVACVVPRPGHQLTADEVDQLVQDSLMITKKIKIGVIFLQELPTTSTGKIDRKKLKNIALQMYRD